METNFIVLSNMSRDIVDLPESLLLRAQTAEVLHGLWHDVRPQLHDDPAQHRLADLDVEVHLGVAAGTLFRRDVALKERGKMLGFGEGCFISIFNKHNGR